MKLSQETVLHALHVKHLVKPVSVFTLASAVSPGSICMTMGLVWESVLLLEKGTISTMQMV